MFRKSTTSTTPDLFNSFTQNLTGTRHTKFSDPHHWHNLFREQVVAKIDEDPFRCLYCLDNGSPNTSIRILLGMMIMKEGFGWSDERLFEEAQFNILVMSSLGLTNVNDSVACIATYYNFRRALYEHQINTGEDLVSGVFKQLTKAQAQLFGVSGKFTRMDSKLMGSNICKSSRLQLIINVLQVFYKEISEMPSLKERLTESDRELLETLMKRKAGNQIYDLDKEQREARLEELGYLLYRLQQLYNETESGKYHLLTRVLAEQYKIKGEKIDLKDVKEIKSDSLQSAYDQDAAYRKKGDQKVQGYSINITETCNDDQLNLITDVKTEKANYADNDFYCDAVKRSEEIVGYIEHTNADGAYHSQENQQFAEKNETQLILGNIQGREGKYAFEEKEDQSLAITNKESGEVHQAELLKSGKYRIKEGGKLKYFTQAVIASFFLRQQIEGTSGEELKRRNNVEASIFQLSYFTRNKKTRYRGQIKHQRWAYCRCLWINLIRIKNWMSEVCPDGNNSRENQGILTKATEILTNSVACCVEKVINGICFFMERLIAGLFYGTPWLALLRRVKI